MAKAATDMYANNIYNLVDEFFDDETKTFGLNLEDDILAAVLLPTTASPTTCLTTHTKEPNHGNHLPTFHRATGCFLGLS